MFTKNRRPITGPEQIRLWLNLLAGDCRQNLLVLSGARPKGMSCFAGTVSCGDAPLSYVFLRRESEKWQSTFFEPIVVPLSQIESIEPSDTCSAASPEEVAWLKSLEGFRACNPWIALEVESTEPPRLVNNKLHIKL